MATPETPETLPPLVIESPPDAIVLLRDISWEVFEALLEAKGDDPSPRYAYLEGQLEIVSPSIGHERVKTNLARLLETYSLICDVEINGIGSTTLKEKLRKVGVEPDECYFVGRDGADDERPDMAIEVEWSRGILDKKAIYAALGVRELWIWRRRGGLEVNRLEGETYLVIPASELIPGVDLQMMGMLATQGHQYATIQSWRRYLEARKGG